MLANGGEASARRSARAGSGHAVGGRSRATSARRGPRHRNDRSRLGAGDEAGGGDRDRPRRPHLPRRHRQPRARRARVVGTGNGHVSSIRPATTSRCPAPKGETGSSIAGALPFRVERTDLADAAAAAYRTSCSTSANPARPSRCRPAQRRRGPRAHGVHHRQRTCACIRWRCCIPSRSPTPRTRAEIDAADPRLRRQGGSTSSTGSPKGVGHDRRRLLPEGRHRAPLGLQDQRVRRPPRRRRLRAEGREPDARVSAAPRATTTTGYRDGFALECRAMRKVREEHGPREREADGPVLPHRRGRPARARARWPRTGSSRASAASRST